MGFINFHVHSEYSLCSSFLTIDDITRYSAENGFDGCCVTDTNCIKGFIELSSRSVKYNLKPVFGCQIIVKGLSGRGHYPLLLIALERKGLLNLNDLSARIGLLNHAGMFDPIPLSVLSNLREGLAVLAGAEFYACRHERVLIKKICERYIDVFGENFFLEINYTGIEKIVILREMVKIAEENSLRPIATCEARYLSRDRDVFNRLFTGTGPYDPSRECDYSLKGAVEIKNHFKNHQDYLENVSMLFDMIGNNLIARSFPMPEYKNCFTRLKKICEKKLSKYPGDIQYSERLAAELNLIEAGGLSSYFLFAYELACLMRIKGIIQGPGNGVLPSSLVMNLIGFTKIDPVKYGLVAELLVTPGTDFLLTLELEISRKRQSLIYSYITSKFGPGHSAYMTAVIRRPRSAGLIESLARGFKYETESIVLVRDNISELAPLYTDGGRFRYSGLTSEDSIYCPFFRVIMKSGSQISIIEEGCRSAGIKTIDYEDRETYLMIREGRTNGIFILENFSIREYLRSSAADSIKVLGDVIAIYRKDSIKNGTASNYITRRENNRNYGRVSPRAHETNPITWDTYGLILYEEQVLLIMHEAAGMDWEGSINFLHAITNKNNKAILSFKNEFIRGCISKGSGEESALRLFGILVEKGGQVVKKSQMLGHAYLAFSLAYIKAHSPIDFYLANLNGNMFSIDKLNRILIDLMIEGPPGSVLPVDINRSLRRFSKENGKVRAGLAVVKNLSREVASEIVSERKRNGFFKDMLDFSVRMVPLGLHEKALENLVKSGAFRDSSFKMEELLACVQAIFKFSCREGRDGSRSLFKREEFSPDLGYFIKNSGMIKKKFSSMSEFEATDAYISNHPLDRIIGRIENYSVDYLDSLHELAHGTFIVYMFQYKVKGKNSARGLICDKSGMTQVVFTPPVYRHYASILKNHTIYILKGNIKSGQVFAGEVYLFDEIAGG